MKKNFALITMLAFSNIALAQSFNPIIIERTSFYKCNNNAHIMPIMVDSITVDENDTIYHFYKTWDYQKATGYGWGDDECVTPYGPSWIGHKAIYKQDGRFLFFNFEKDTLTLKPFAATNSKWVFYTFSNGDKLWATVDSIYAEEILGTSSLLKSISFKRKNPQGVIDPYFPDNLRIIISDSIGFITLFPFRNLFDQDLDFSLWGNFNIPLSNYSIIGLTNPDVGKTFISSVSIYDFNIDDEFHYSSSSSSGWGTADFVSENTKRISRVTDKSYSNNNDTIIYTWHNIKRYEKIDYGNSQHQITYSEYSSTSRVNIAYTSYYFPERAILDETDYPHYSQKMHSNNRMRIIPLVQPFIMLDVYPCWRLVWAIKHSAMESDGYGEGIGYLGDYYESDYSSSAFALEYYKKGYETWGTPIVITSVSTSPQINFSIYPNPVIKGEYLNITAPETHYPYNISLINSIGQIVGQWFGIVGNYQMQLPVNASKGFYFILFRGQGGETSTKKLLIN